MNLTIIPAVLFGLSLVVYIPLATLLLYVWHKYGDNNRAVKQARLIFLFGTLCLFGYMLFI